MNNNSPNNTILAACAVILTGIACYSVFLNHRQPQFYPPVYPQHQNDLFSPQNYPLNMDVTSYLGRIDLEPSFVAEGMGDKLISVAHKVTYNEETHTFEYKYKFSFTGKQKCFLCWDLIDKVHQEKVMIELEPNKIREYSFHSSEAPMLFEGAAYINRKIVVDDAEVWRMERINAQPGPLPRNLVF